MKVEQMRYRRVSELYPLESNPRKISKDDFNRLVDSLHINGFWEHQPFLRNTDGIIVKRINKCVNLRHGRQSETYVGGLRFDRKTNGLKKPRPEQRKRIIEGLHRIGRELQAVTL